MKSSVPAVIGVAMKPGGDGVEPDAGADPLRRHRLPAHPAGEGQLAGAVGAHAVPGDGAGGGLVAGQARLDVLERQARLRGGRVRADGDGAGVGPAGEERPQPVEGGDGAEVVDRRRRGRRRRG